MKAVSEFPLRLADVLDVFIACRVFEAAAADRPDQELLLRADIRT